MYGRRGAGKINISCSKSRVQGHKENGTNQDAQANSDFAELLGYTLCYAIRSACDDSVVNPPNIVDTTHGLKNVEKENSRLTNKIKT
jgi:hypothetical protein